MLNALRSMLLLTLLAVSLRALGQAPPPPPASPPPPPPATAPANSQWRDEKAMLSGAVKDQRGRLVRHAQLTFTGKYSGIRTQCRTADSGQYRISLEVGVYEVDVTAAHIAPLHTVLTLDDTTVKDFTFGSDAAGAGPPAPF